MKYKIVDKTQAEACVDVIRAEWGNILAVAIESTSQAGCLLEVGDALVIRDCLQEHGCTFGKEFYMKKVPVRGD